MCQLIYEETCVTENKKCICSRLMRETDVNASASHFLNYLQ